MTASGLATSTFIVGRLCILRLCILRLRKTTMYFGNLSLAEEGGRRERWADHEFKFSLGDTAKNNPNQATNQQQAWRNWTCAVEIQCTGIGKSPRV